MSGPGWLYGHSQDVDIGWMKDESRYHGNNEYSNGHTFMGILHKVAHYNAALSGATLDELHEYTGDQWIDEPTPRISGRAKWRAFCASQNA